MVSLAAKRMAVSIAAIENFTVDLRSVMKGHTVTVRGQLVYKLGWIGNPIVNEAVYLLVNNTELTSTITDSNGQFVFYWKTTLAGTYELMVKYKGSWAYESCQTIPIQVQVIEPSPPPPTPIPPPSVIPVIPFEYILLAGAAIGFLVLWMVTRKK